MKEKKNEGISRFKKQGKRKPKGHIHVCLHNQDCMLYDMIGNCIKVGEEYALFTQIVYASNHAMFVSRQLWATGEWLVIMVIMVASNVTSHWNRDALEDSSYGQTHCTDQDAGGP